MAAKTATRTMDITKTAGYGLHGDECLCVKCLTTDMDRHAEKVFGFKPSERYADVQPVEAERTRYAAPGTRTGRGTVRKISAAQVNFMKRLMVERDTTNLVRLPGSEDIENMSLKGATDLIERLLACPMKAVAQHPAQEMWTEAQKNYITTLVVQKGADSIPGTPTKREASAIIERLKSLPNAPRPVIATPAKTVTSGAITEDGMYLKDGVIYKVQLAVNGSGRLYAKKFNTETKEFEYAGIAPLRSLTLADKMSREQAGEYGKLYGICMRCSRTLTDEYSIANGYGKICAGKL